MELKRGEIYYLTFPYTLDPKYPKGKPKFVLVLQEVSISQSITLLKLC